MTERHSKELLSALAAVAPGRPLREGLDRILKAGMGALIVIGDGPEVLNISSGGFLVNASFSPQRLSELAKTDGAIVLTPDAGYIARANVHLVPNPNVPTEETGTRHRTAERVARSIGVPVISVSEDMAVLTVYTKNERYQLETIPSILSRCNQALQTLERYKSRLDEFSSNLTSLEVEDIVTLRDVVTLLQRAELVARISEEIEQYLTELGTDGRLVRLQLARDDGRGRGRTPSGRARLLPVRHVVEPRAGDRHPLRPDDRRAARRRRGRADPAPVGPDRRPRLLDRAPRLSHPGPHPASARRRRGEAGGPVRLARQAHTRTSVPELAAVDGVGEHWASTIKDALARIAESSILDRYS